jgi:hypothetical protein
MYEKMEAALIAKNEYDSRKKLESITDNAEGCSIAKIVFVVLSVLCFFAIIITNSVVYYDQVSDIEKLKKIDEKIQVYEERADNISLALAEILIKDYKEYEKSVFESMSSKDGLDFYFVKYPELNTHTVFINYSETYKELMDNIYFERLEKINIQMKIDTRKRYPHVIGFILPRE